MAILSEDNPEFIFNDADQEGGTFQIMPAFVLFAREQRAFWTNLATAGEYAADILSFMSGYGNILKAGKLFKVFKAGEKLILKSKTFTKLAIGARKASGYMEMTSGVGNALLKLTSARETELGKKISQVLFYLEMAALTGEITAALHGSIKKASLKAMEDIDTVDKIRKKAQKIVDDATDKKTKEFLEAQDDLAAIRQLEEFAGSSIRQVGGDGIYGGRVLSKSEIEEWGKLLKRKYGCKLEIVESFDNPKALAQFDPNTNTIMYKKNVTEYLMAHESFHAEEMFKLGFDEFVKHGALKGTKFEDYTPENLIRAYEREKYVHDRIIETSDKFGFNNEELTHNFYNLDWYKWHLEI